MTYKLKPKTRQINAVFPAETYERIIRYMATHEVDASKLVRQAVDEFLERAKIKS
jgi:hypothetical protein